MIQVLQSYLCEQADARPDAPALVLGESWTYSSVEETSNRLAALLVDAGCRPGDRIGILLPKSIRAVISILATLKASCIYVPLDTATPVRRLAAIIDSCAFRCILTGESFAGQLAEALHLCPAARDVRIGWLNDTAPRLPSAFTWSDLAAAPSTPFACHRKPDDPAHILFTSGSTGTPKGVVVTHASVCHFVDWAVGEFDMQAGDRHSGHPPLHFDLSTFDMFGTFASGATLYLITPEMSLLPHKLADFIRTNRLTQWFSVPSLLHYMAKFDAIRPRDFPDLRRLLWCGEAIATPTLIHWMNRLPHVRFTNLYGPTETAIASSYYHVPSCPLDETARIPIGAACPGEELVVLDEQLQPALPGETGMLYIRGVGLSPGYWQDPKKTAEVFLNTPDGRMYRTGDLASVDDGLIYLHGRADSQIKTRGYRIELGDIESALRTVPGVADCAVVAVPTQSFAGLAICCAYTASEQHTPESLRRQLVELLPPYMIPAQWRAMTALPLNANGKTDRVRLREEFASLDA